MRTTEAFQWMVLSTVTFLGTWVLPLAIFYPDVYERNRDLILFFVRIGGCFSSDCAYNAFPPSSVMRIFQYVASNQMFHGVLLPSPALHFESILAANFLWLHRTDVWRPGFAAINVPIILGQAMCGIALPMLCNRWFVQSFQRALHASATPFKEESAREGSASASDSESDTEYVSQTQDLGYFGYKVEGISPRDLQAADVELLCRSVSRQVRGRHGDDLSVRVSVLEGCVLLLARVWSDAASALDVALDPQAVLDTLPTRLRGTVTSVQAVTSFASDTLSLTASEPAAVPLGSAPTCMALRVKDLPEGSLEAWRAVAWLSGPGNAAPKRCQLEVASREVLRDGSAVVTVQLPPIYHAQVVHVALEAAQGGMSHVLHVPCLPAAVIADITRGAGKGAAAMLGDIGALLEWLQTSPSQDRCALANLAPQIVRSLQRYAEASARPELARWVRSWLAPRVLSCCTPPRTAPLKDEALYTTPSACSKEELDGSLLWAAMSPFTPLVAAVLMLCTPSLYSAHHGLWLSGFRVAA